MMRYLMSLRVSLDSSFPISSRILAQCNWQYEGQDPCELNCDPSQRVDIMNWMYAYIFGRWKYTISDNLCLWDKDILDQ